MKWDIIDSQKGSAKALMDKDAKMLKALHPTDPPILHFYDFEKPAATYGHFIDPTLFFSDQANIDLAKRPTGGGILFHTSDLTFSLLMPSKQPFFSTNTLDNYAWVHKIVGEAIAQFLQKQTTKLIDPPKALSCKANHFCLAHPTKYDLMIDGKKVVGAAQRKTRNGFLHQGTIILAIPDRLLVEQTLIGGSSLYQLMQKQSYPLLGDDCTLMGLFSAKNSLKNILRKIFLSS